MKGQGRGGEEAGGREQRGLTLDSIQRRLLILHIQVLHPLAQNQGQLDLIVQVDASRPDDRALAGEQNGRSRLLEKEGLLGAGAVQLGNVVASNSRRVSAAPNHLGAQLGPILPKRISSRW